MKCENYEKNSFFQLKQNVFEESYFNFKMSHEESMKAQIEGLEVNSHDVS